MHALSPSSLPCIRQAANGPAGDQINGGVGMAGGGPRGALLREEHKLPVDKSNGGEKIDRKPT